MPGKAHHSEKWHRCWEKVQAGGKDESSAAAICTAQLGDDSYDSEATSRSAERVRQFHIRGALGAVRTAMHDGREHVVVPVVALMEGVIHAINASTPEFVPSRALSTAPQSWNGRPVMLGHPVVNGVQVSANTPEVLQSSCIGTVFQSRMNGNKLLMEAWLDPLKIQKVPGGLKMLERVKNGEVCEVSVGAFVLAESRQGIFNGKEYKGVWNDILPDHLAFLPKGVGACSVAMGCGTHRAAEAVEEPVFHLLTAEGFRVAAPMSDKSQVSTGNYHVVKDGKPVSQHKTHKEARLAAKKLGDGHEVQWLRAAGGKGSGNWGHGSYGGTSGRDQSKKDFGHIRSEAESKASRTVDNIVNSPSSQWKQKSADLSSEAHKLSAQAKDAEGHVKAYTAHKVAYETHMALKEVSQRARRFHHDSEANRHYDAMERHGKKFRGLGGPGSGNFGHGGRPGEKGGSSGGGGSDDKVTTKHTTAVEAAKAHREAVSNLKKQGFTVKDRVREPGESATYLSHSDGRQATVGSTSLRGGLPGKEETSHRVDVEIKGGKKLPGGETEAEFAARLEKGAVGPVRGSDYENDLFGQVRGKKSEDTFDHKAYGKTPDAKYSEKEYRQVSSDLKAKGYTVSHYADRGQKWSNYDKTTGSDTHRVQVDHTVDKNYQRTGEHRIRAYKLKGAGGPGSGWTREGGHVPGAQSAAVASAHEAAAKAHQEAAAEHRSHGKTKEMVSPESKAAASTRKAAQLTDQAIKLHGDATDDEIGPHAIGASKYSEIAHLESDYHHEAARNHESAAKAHKMAASAARGELKGLGGPGSGWTREGGHVPGSQGGTGHAAAAAAHETAANLHRVVASGLRNDQANREGKNTAGIKREPYGPEKAARAINTKLARETTQKAVAATKGSGSNPYAAEAATAYAKMAHKTTDLAEKAKFHESAASMHEAARAWHHAAGRVEETIGKNAWKLNSKLTRKSNPLNRGGKKMKNLGGPGSGNFGHGGRKGEVGGSSSGDSGDSKKWKDSSKEKGLGNEDAKDALLKAKDPEFFYEGGRISLTTSVPGPDGVDYEVTASVDSTSPAGKEEARATLEKAIRDDTATLQIDPEGRSSSNDSGLQGRAETIKAWKEAGHTEDDAWDLARDHLDVNGAEVMKNEVVIETTTNIDTPDGGTYEATIVVTAPYQKPGPEDAEYTATDQMYDAIEAGEAKIRILGGKMTKLLTLEEKEKLIKEIGLSQKDANQIVLNALQENIAVVRHLENEIVATAAEILEDANGDKFTITVNAVIPFQDQKVEDLKAAMFDAVDEGKAELRFDASPYDSPAQIDSEESAELVVYKTMRELCDQVGSTYESLSDLVDELISAEEEDPTETAEEEAAETELEQAQLESVRTYSMAMYSNLNAVMTLVNSRLNGASPSFLAGKMQECPTCEGTGTSKGNTCPTCDGKGEIPLRAASGARHSSSDREIIQGVHDNAVALGAKCPEARMAEEQPQPPVLPQVGSEEGEPMKFTKEQRVEVIRTLVANKHSGFVADDEKMLDAASDDRLEGFRVAAEARAKEVKEQKTEKTLTEEDFMRLAPESLRTLITRTQAADTSRKAELVAALKACQEEYSESELSTMPLDQLERMGRLAKLEEREEPMSYGGRAFPRSASGKEKENDVFANPPDPYAPGLKKLRDLQSGSKAEGDTTVN